MIKGFNSVDGHAILLMAIIFFVLAEDYFDFISADVGEGISKGFFTIVIFCLMTFYYKSK